MKHIKEQRVYYHDTDSYGVVWHGAYLKWFEEGRVELCEMLGLRLDEMQKDGIVLPVVDLNVRYKASALFDDRLIIETGISELKPMSITFSHIVRNKNTDKIYVLANAVIVALGKDGRLIKRFPDYMTEAFEKGICAACKNL